MSEHARLLRALWKVTVSEWGKPSRNANQEDLLNHAQRQMEEIHARNRDRAVQAIIRKNNLEMMVADLERKVQELGEQAAEAENEGEPERALRLRKEKEGYQVSLDTTIELFKKATETAERIKAHIQREQEEVRKRTAELLAIQAEWKTSTITQEMERQVNARVYRVFDETYNLYPLKAARDLLGISVAIIIGLLILLFVALH